MNTNIEISVIIATFNSEKTLSMVLEAVQKQTFPQKKIEILLIDGGSLDKTKAIGKKYQCTIIKNPRTEPVYAKYLGFIHANGDYIVYLDHDEVLENKNSLLIKSRIMKQDKAIKAVVGTGYKNPLHYPFINAYINEFGDPFSFFIYRLSKDTRFFLTTMKERYIFNNKRDHVKFDFSHIQHVPLIELCAAGSMIDKSYIKRTFPEITKVPQLIPHIFYFFIKKDPFIAITKNDALIHYSSESVGKYLAKIRWRIKNNIFHTQQMGAAGFSGRQIYHENSNQYKKYLFILYALSIFFPLCDALYLVASRKKIQYIVHVPLCMYTGALIVYYYCMKIFGYHPRLRSYDEKQIIE